MRVWLECGACRCRRWCHHIMMRYNVIPQIPNAFRKTQIIIYASLWYWFSPFLPLSSPRFSSFLMFLFFCFHFVYFCIVVVAFATQCRMFGGRLFISTLTVNICTARHCICSTQTHVISIMKRALQSDRRMPFFICFRAYLWWFHASCLRSHSSHGIFHVRLLFEFDSEDWSTDTCLFCLFF